jgi:hypothetical protein
MYAYIYAKLGYFPPLVSCNELAGTPMEAPLDGSVKRASKREYARGKYETTENINRWNLATAFDKRERK